MAFLSRLIVFIGFMTTVSLKYVNVKGSDAIAKDSSFDSIDLLNGLYNDDNDINNKNLIRRLTWWYRYYGDSSDSGSGSNSGSKSGSKSDSGRFRRSSSGSKSGSDSDSGRKSKSDSKSVSKSDSKRGSGSNSASKSDSDSGSDSGSKSNSKSFSKSVSDSKSGSKSLSKSDSKDDDDDNKDNGEKYWIRLNCGADGRRDEDGTYSYFDPYGLYWISDYGYSNSDEIECCGDYNYYDKEIYRSGTFKSGDDDLVYTFNDIPNGIYFIRLRFAEIFFDSPGDRRFGIIVNGDHKEESVDIIDWVGKNEPLDLEYYSIEVRYNYMEIRFTKIANDPKCSGIEVYQVDHPYW